MKNSDEMINDLFERRDKYIKDQKIKQRKMMKANIGTLSVCLVAAIGFVAVRTGLLDIRRSAAQTADSTVPVSDYQFNESVKESALDMATSEDNVNTSIPDFTTMENDTSADTAINSDQIPVDDPSPHVAIDKPEDEGFTLWNEKNVTYSLYRLIETGETSPVKLSLRPFLSFNFYLKNDFVYKGKTLEEYYLADGEEKMLPEKLSQLLKEGDSLKYGTALYETGNPAGEKWYKSLYDERVEFYGKKLLDTYLLNGEFLKDKLLEDLEKSKKATEAQLAFKEAETACMNTLVAQMPAELNAYYDPHRRVIIFTTTLEDFKSFTSVFGEACIYDIARFSSPDPEIGVDE